MSIILTNSIFSWQVREWPEIEQVEELVVFAKEKIEERESYKSPNPKLDLAELPANEYPESIKELSPQAVFIEQDILLVALLFDSENIQAISVVPNPTKQLDWPTDWTVEETESPYVFRITTTKRNLPEQALHTTSASASR